jgi:hypothetical protein
MGCDTMQFGREVAENIIPHTAFINAIFTGVNVFHYKMTTSFHHKNFDYFLHKIFQYTSPAQTISISRLFITVCFCPQNAFLSKLPTHNCDFSLLHHCKQAPAIFISRTMYNYYS